LSDDFVVPDYQGRCITNLVPSIYRSLASSPDPAFAGKVDDLLKREGIGESQAGSILPETLDGIDSVVLLVLDGLGYRQLIDRVGQLEHIAQMKLEMVHSVAPTTTACALTSLTTGLAPSRHGLVGYRMRIGSAAIMNTLKWATDRDCSVKVPEPKTLQPHEPFFGLRPMVVTKALYDNTGFTKAHLRNVRTRYWRTLSQIVSTVADLRKENERFIYLYYEGLDTTAHEYGLGDHYERELEFIDYLVGQLMKVIGKNTALLITADHGQVEVLDPPIHLHSEILSKVLYQSGEGRFRWLHLKVGKTDEVASLCERYYGDLCRVLTREEMLEAKLLGPSMQPEVALRLGDVALIATKPVAFYDPCDTGPFELVCRHGALTAEEIEVPLLSSV
jgi:hypothetical protein